MKVRWNPSDHVNMATTLLQPYPGCQRSSILFRIFATQFHCPERENNLRHQGYYGHFISSEQKLRK